MAEPGHLDWPFFDPVYAREVLQHIIGADVLKSGAAMKQPADAPGGIARERVTP